VALANARPDFVRTNAPRPDRRAAVRPLSGNRTPSGLATRPVRLALLGSGTMAISTPRSGWRGCGAAVDHALRERLRPVLAGAVRTLFGAPCLPAERGAVGARPVIT
jgi:hypothetical protein